MKTAAEIESGMAHQIGTTSYTKHALWPKLVMTDGIIWLREAADCYWLIDAIASYRRTEEFQVWELKKTGSSAVLTMKEDSGQPELVRQEIEYTDFPLDEIKFFVQLGGYGTPEKWTPAMVLMLTNEY